VIHALIGCSIIFFRPQLSQIPLAVLLGLFLFLGQSSLGGNQMVRDKGIVRLL
jgi:MFS superfamily sulfate permease-like transporter